MNVVGLDLAITATGMTRTLDGEAETQVIKTKGTGDDRLLVIQDRIETALQESWLIEFALLEGWFVGRNSAASIIMVHGAVRAMMIDRAIPFGVMPPMNLKKYATGNSNATKSDMAVAAFKRAGLEFQDDNACDSWWLWVAAQDHLDAPLFPLPVVQRDQLKKIEIRWSPK